MVLSKETRMKLLSSYGKLLKASKEADKETEKALNHLQSFAGKSSKNMFLRAKTALKGAGYNSDMAEIAELLFQDGNNDLIIDSWTSVEAVIDLKMKGLWNEKVLYYDKTMKRSCLNSIKTRIAARLRNVEFCPTSVNEGSASNAPVAGASSETLVTGAGASSETLVAGAGASSEMPVAGAEAVRKIIHLAGKLGEAEANASAFETLVSGVGATSEMHFAGAGATSEMPVAAAVSEAEEEGSTETNDFQINDLQAKLEEVKAKTSDREDEIHLLKHKVLNLEAKLGEVVSNAADREAELQLLKYKLQDAETKLRKSECEVDILKEEIALHDFLEDRLRLQLKKALEVQDKCMADNPLEKGTFSCGQDSG